MAKHWLSSIFSLRNAGKSASRVGPAFADVLLISASDNASISYLIEPYLASLGWTSVRVDPEELIKSEVCESEFSMVVIVRYLPSKCIRVLNQFKLKGAQIVYFMDDDLMDRLAVAGLPPEYIKKILVTATRQRHVLENLCDEFWVGTQYLAHKYASWSPRVLVPRPAEQVVNLQQTVQICYHGSASHGAELQWLVPVITAVNNRMSAAHFEVFGDRSVNRLYRNVPRAAVLHPMSWPNYLAYTSSIRRHIALAPLLPSPFNEGRGVTKFFDFARMGSVGIYTDIAPYKGFIRNGVDGILLPNDPATWVSAICALAEDCEKQIRMAQAAQCRAMQIARGFADMCD